jgi:hypothetical protein
MTAVWLMLMPLAGSRKTVPVCASSAEVPERQPVHLHGRRRHPKRCRAAPGARYARPNIPLMSRCVTAEGGLAAPVAGQQVPSRPWARAECASLAGRGIQQVDSRKSWVPPPGQHGPVPAAGGGQLGEGEAYRLDDRLLTEHRDVGQASPAYRRSVMTFPG